MVDETIDSSKNPNAIRIKLMDISTPKCLKTYLGPLVMALRIFLGLLNRPTITDMIIGMSMGSRSMNISDRPAVTRRYWKASAGIMASTPMSIPV